MQIPLKFIIAAGASWSEEHCKSGTSNPAHFSRDFPPSSLCTPSPKNGNLLPMALAVLTGLRLMVMPPTEKISIVVIFVARPWCCNLLRLKQWEGKLQTGFNILHRPQQSIKMFFGGTEDVTVKLIDITLTDIGLESKSALLTSYQCRSDYIPEHH